ncbi:MAG TPA: hypothetical protein VNM92_16435 [Thermoanaerobaculia bacterium]|nr:hypothetical protein [Thermoanaerobaculia bacterium]
MSITVALVAVIAIVAAIALAFVPLKLMVDGIARNITEPIKRFIERQRERRSSSRDLPDRRKRDTEPPTPSV